MNKNVRMFQHFSYGIDQNTPSINVYTNWENLLDIYPWLLQFNPPGIGFTLILEQDQSYLKIREV
jgi:hypothetical protein